MRHARPELLPSLPVKSKDGMTAVAITPADVPRLTSGLNQLFGQVGQYYSKKITTYGPTPFGVDWSCVPTQEMRFVQLLKICAFSGGTNRAISLNDIGCGYGALLAFLDKRHRKKKIDYLGVDISPAMIAQARLRWKARAVTSFQVGSSGFRVADYSVASGIFNVKLTQPTAMWEKMIGYILSEMHTTSQRGFSVNFLTPMPDGTSHIPELYCAPPDVWCSYCQQTLGAQVEVVTGYGLREYTLLVRHASSSTR